ncbi:MAG: TatD family hydrolase [Agriterribacter sp.]
MTYIQTPLKVLYIDIHTHFYKPDAEVSAIENISGNFPEIPNDRTVSAGLHPWWLNDAENKMAQLRSIGNRKNLAAIGECGLDKLTKTEWNIQLQFFEVQLQLAADLHKPVIIHCVKAFTETLAMLKGIKVPVIFHGINNKLPIIQPVIERNYYLSFGKSLLVPGDTIRNSLNAVPVSQLFLETDDSKAHIKDIYKSAAEIRNISENEIALQLQKNYHTVFNDAGY